LALSWIASAWVCACVVLTVSAALTPGATEMGGLAGFEFKRNTAVEPANIARPAIKYIADGLIFFGFIEGLIR
jgi:hypothetical protein